VITLDYGFTAVNCYILTVITRQHWIQRITFAAETNAADTHTAGQMYTQTQYLLHSLSDGEGT